MANSQQMKMLRQIQQMQQDMQAAQAAIAEATLEASAGGGVVTVTVNGEGEVRAISIDRSVVDPDDVETLEDLVLAALTEAARQARAFREEQMGAVTGGIDLGSLGGGLGGLLG